ncbi:acyl-CoA thioesterase, partial [Virgibacillus salexigens]|uniref:acyl-CoA thioesterase n=1 Tax=Virgibacillus salexigens TaxID=61016 RepID=UPI0030817A64
MDYVHEIDIYVRFSETDAAGHVNNVSYFFYFEVARTKFFKIVCPERNDALNFIWTSISCDYISQPYAGQELKLYSYVTNVGGKSFTIGHTLSDKATG